VTTQNRAVDYGQTCTNLMLAALELWMVAPTSGLTLPCRMVGDGLVPPISPRKAHLRRQFDVADTGKMPHHDCGLSANSMRANSRSTSWVSGSPCGRTAR